MNFIKTDMKRISSLCLVLLTLVFWGCSETEQPYSGYVEIQWRGILPAASGSTTTVTADTDITSGIVVENIDFGDADSEWCTASVSGKDILVTATETNNTGAERTATVQVRYGYWVTSFIVLQVCEGQTTIQHDWATWTATGNSVETGDGGGYPSLFTEDRTTFWHSQYSGDAPGLPYWIVVDMQEELEVVRFDIGRRYYAGTGNNYGTVKTLNIYASTDNENFTQVGGFTFELPWTAPDGTVVTSATHPLIPAFEQIDLDAPVVARYIRLEITETNTGNNACQIAYFKAYGPIE